MAWVGTEPSPYLAAPVILVVAALLVTTGARGDQAGVNAATAAEDAAAIGGCGEKETKEAMTGRHGMAAIPTPEQVEWQDMELGMFIHFGVETWQGVEEDELSTSLDCINPTALDTDQWVSVAEQLGAKYIVFVAKHSGGFSMWQTDTTDYGIKNTPWRSGKGDVLGDLSASCRARGMKLGVYLCPTDRHLGATVGGRCADSEAQARYDAIYRQQLTEVLTRYGEISEVWFDGSTVTPVGDILAARAPRAMVFQGKHATIRWVGNEDGFAPYPGWNAVSEAAAKSGVSTAAQGDPEGEVWLPLEVDTTMRDHYWMWHPDTEHTLKPLDHLMQMYYRSVGHGAVLLLNSNPDTNGRIPEADAKRAAEFGAEIRRRFGQSIAEGRGEGGEIELPLDAPARVDHVITMEDIALGERIREYVIEGHSDGRWSELARGTAVGHKRIDYFAPRTVSRLRFRALRAVGPPALRRFAAYQVGITPQIDRDAVVIHDPYLVGRWGEEVGSSWTTLDFDITDICSQAGQYEVEMRLRDEAAPIEVSAVRLLHHGLEAPDFTLPTPDPLRWHLNVTGITAELALRVVLRRRDEGTAGGEVIIRPR